MFICGLPCHMNYVCDFFMHHVHTCEEWVGGIEFRGCLVLKVHFPAYALHRIGHWAYETTYHVNNLVQSVHLHYTAFNGIRVYCINTQVWFDGA